MHTYRKHFSPATHVEGSRLRRLSFWALSNWLFVLPFCLQTSRNDIAPPLKRSNPGDLRCASRQFTIVTGITQNRVSGTNKFGREIVSKTTPPFVPIKGSTETFVVMTGKPLANASSTTFGNPSEAEVG